MRLIRLINEYLEKEPKPTAQRSYFYLTEAGMTPYEAFKSLTLPAKHTPRMKRALHNGCDVHKRIRDYLYNIGVVKAAEVQIKTGLFRGRADAILFSDGRLAVLEIKSVSRAEFEKLKKYCSRQAYAQIQLYLHYLNIEHGIILVECKDDQRLKEYHIQRKPRAAREQIVQFTALKAKLVEAGVMSQ